MLLTYTVKRRIYFMGTLELVMISVGLAMDAFAAAVCKGRAIQSATPKQMSAVGAWFGVFQAIMPLLGFFLGYNFKSYIESIDHWIAFILLGTIGINMVKEALSGKKENVDVSISVKSMLPMALATSIDALAVGITFACLNVNIYASVILIGCITFAISSAGVKIGNVFGIRYKSKAELFGGAVLIFIGIKILFEHLGFIGV